MWQINESLGNKAESYRYLRLYMEEYQRNVNEVMKQEVPKTRAREAIARQNDTMKLLEQDAELSRRMVYVAVLLLVVLLLVAAVLFVYFWQRYKIRRIENRELRNSLRQEALIYSVNRKNFEHDIKQKDCEISSSTLLLANKNEVLQQISAIANISIGMRAKQIAEMLSVSPESINTNRYRLRKKLGLQRGDSLDEYLRRI